MINGDDAVLQTSDEALGNGLPSDSAAATDALWPLFPHPFHRGVKLGSLRFTESMILFKNPHIDRVKLERLFIVFEATETSSDKAYLVCQQNVHKSHTKNCFDRKQYY